VRDLGGYVRALTPRRILAIGWFGFLAYAYPGFMSFDSITQLKESRSGYLIDGHPPFMAALWRVVELFVAGPVGMLLLQVTAFLVGAYLIFRAFMSPRAAAVAATLVLWFPPIAGIMAVIWKDAQMTGYLILGFGLILQDRRRDRLLGLVAMLAATLMRHNALVITGPLIVLAFVWNPSHGFIKRHAIAIAAWVAVTFSAQLISGWLTDEQQHIWHTSLALCDMTATLRYTSDTVTDADLARDAPGVPFLVQDVQARVRAADFGDDYVNNLWKLVYRTIDRPLTDEARQAVTRAWKKIVLGHTDGYVRYRWEIVRRLFGLGGEPMTSPIYNWFADIQDPFFSASVIDHDAYGSHVQNFLREEIHVVGVTPIFNVVVYLVLSVLLVPFAFIDRRIVAMLASGLTSEGVLLVIAPTTDWRYSFSLVVAVVFATVMLVARRMHR
jgi:hypothetical protein